MAKKKISSKKQFKYLWAVVAFVLLVIIGLFITHQPSFAPTTQDITSNNYNFDFGNHTIKIDGEIMKFKNGAYEGPDKQHVALIMNKTLSSDGTRAAAIIVDSPGGSGTFYYLIGGSVVDGKVTYSSNIIPLGDRIKINSMEVDNPKGNDNGLILVKFMDRPENSPMSTTPSIEVIGKYAFETNGNLIEVN